jgi:chromatin modification-related protein VID21
VHSNANISIAAKAMQQRAQAQGSAQAAQASGVQSGVQANPAATTALAGTIRLGVPGQLAVPPAAAARQTRLPPGMQAPVAGMGSVPGQMNGLVHPIPMNTVPQAQIQALQAQRLSMSGQQPNMNMLMQVRQIQDQQRQAVQMQQQQQAQQQSSHLSSPPQGHLTAQQAGAGMPPSSQAAQLAQMAQMMHPGQMPKQMNGLPQSSPSGIRPPANGINQQNYMANAQALMSAQFGGINGAGLAGSPAGGIGVASGSSSSPRPNALHLDTKIYPTYAAQIVDLQNAYLAKQPNLTPNQAQHLAHEHMARLIVQKRQQQQQQQQELSQSAMNAAAGGATPQGLSNGLPNGMAASNSPHQYAQMLRAQQQLQAAQASIQQNGQQQGGQHQRHSSGSAASVAGK